MFVLLARAYFRLVMVPAFALAAVVRRLFRNRLDMIGHISPASTWSVPGKEGRSRGWLFFVAVITLPLAGLIRLDHLWKKMPHRRGADLSSSTSEISPFLYQMH